MVSPAGAMKQRSVGLAYDPVPISASSADPDDFLDERQLAVKKWSRRIDAVAPQQCLIYSVLSIMSITVREDPLCWRFGSAIDAIRGRRDRSTRFACSCTRAWREVWRKLHSIFWCGVQAWY